jgi:hypothetical protein
MRILGFQTVIGVPCRIREQVVTGADPQTFRNFWTTNDEGDLFLHGAMNLSFPIAFAYVPPVQVLDSPLGLGRSWSTTVVVYFNLEGTGEPEGPFDFGYEVLSEGTVVVPAGSFYAYGVGPILGQPTVWVANMGAFALDGAFLGGNYGGQTLGEIENWYCDGLGIPKMSVSGEFELISWEEPPPTGVEGQSWGQIKSLYR